MLNDLIKFDSNHSKGRMKFFSKEIENTTKYLQSTFLWQIDVQFRSLAENNSKN